jgi:hypothetical protein
MWTADTRVPNEMQRIFIYKELRGSLTSSSRKKRICALCNSEIAFVRTRHGRDRSDFLRTLITKAVQIPP